PAERARWSARFAAGSLAALDAARERAQDLAEVPRLFPDTLGAARATLMLADQALECGQRERARSWIAECALEASAIGDDALARALAARRDRLAAPAPRAAEAWTEAAGALPVGTASWSEPARRGTSRARSGAVFTTRDELAIQTANGDVLLFGPGRDKNLALG